METAMKLLKRLLAVLAIALALPAIAQDVYPSRSIRLIVPLPPGGASDNGARMLADHLSNVWKQPVLVENRPGGNGIIGTQAVAQARPDGYTLLFAVPSISTFKAFLSNPPVDVEKDLAPVSLLVDKGYYLLVNANLPVNNVRELISYAKANPGKLNYGAYAGGNTLAVELFKQMAGTDIVKVQYKGEALAALAVANDEVQVSFGSKLAAQAFIDSGKIRLLAVTTGKRAPTLPNLPTVAETVPGYEPLVWYGLLAPAGTAPAILRKLHSEIVAFARRPDITKRFAELEYAPRATSPEEFSVALAAEIKRWTEVARSAGVKPE
jgi:tripartite-type tricarboxylate transporter receptor subunit TctC